MKEKQQNYLFEMESWVQSIVTDKMEGGPQEGRPLRDNLLGLRDLQVLVCKLGYSKDPLVATLLEVLLYTDHCPG